MDDGRFGEGWMGVHSGSHEVGSGLDGVVFEDAGVLLEGLVADSAGLRGSCWAGLFAGCWKDLSEE